MKESFIKKLAFYRAKKIFTPEYFKTVTDSWYLDELFVFEEFKIGKEERKPTEEEKDIYMKELSNLFDDYRDRYYGEPLAQDCYSKCIDCFDKLLNIIEYGNEKCRCFEIDEETIKKVKNLGNIFVNKHNEFCK